MLLSINAEEIGFYSQGLILFQDKFTLIINSIVN